MKGSAEDTALDDFVIDFARMVSGMEERFVPLGEDLGNIVRHLQSLAQAAGDGFASVRQEISSGALGALDVKAHASLDALRRQLGGVARRMQPLADVAEDLRRLRSLSADVRRIGAFLQACGSSFAVESARREDSRAAFSAFVQELRGLANQIGSLAERMDNDSCATLVQLTTARRRIGENVGELERLAHTMQGAFATASGEIQQFMATTRDVLDRVERHRAAIARQTGGVIEYLQFGDLVRQKCEHVLDAAREAQGASGETFSIIVRTSAAQLELIQSEVDEARDHLTDGYAGLQRELAQLADCGQALSGGSEGVANDSWARLKARLRDLDEVQKKEATLNLDAVKTAGDAGASAAALQAGLGGVREMSSHLHLLALNAIIQTVHLGVHGRTLEELAQHVDSLHRTCETVVPEVINLLEGIACRVANFTGDGADGNDFNLDGLCQLEGVQQSGQEVMRNVLGLAGTGEAMLRAAVHRLETLHQLSEEISAHRSALMSIASSLPAPSASAGTSDFDARMNERYTMRSERDAHLRARGLKPSATAAALIEFFSAAREKSPSTPLLATATASEGDLGDSVEFF